MISNFLQGKKVLVMGLGLVGGGVETVKWLAQQGAKITVTDLRNKKELKPSLEKLKNYKIKYVLGKHQIKDFINTDLIIKNPAVPPDSPYLKAARRAEINIETDLSLFFKFYPGQIIGITGTKGKSTTASLIYQILKTAGRKVHPVRNSPRLRARAAVTKGRLISNGVHLAGNIGSSPLKYLSRHLSNQLTILELSSFQLEDLNVSPQIAVITNLFPDHLNRYKNFREYVKAKEIIFKYQKPNDCVILNYDDKMIRKLAKKLRAQIYPVRKPRLSAERGDRDKVSNGVYWFSRYKLPVTKQGAFIGGGKIYWKVNRKSMPIAEVKDIKLLGQHNLSNVLAAVTVACLVGVDPKIIKEVLKKFAGIPNRLELVATISGVEYINDTTATNPDSAIAGIKAVNAKQRIILISGGADKNLKFSARGGSAFGGKNFVQVIKENCKVVILLPGSATPKIKQELKLVGYRVLVEVRNMTDAVKQAQEISKRGDVILLSPGCASFGLFTPLEIQKKHFFIKDKHLMAYALECKKRWGVKSLTGFKNEFDRGRQFKEFCRNFQG